MRKPITEALKWLNMKQDVNEKATSDMDKLNELAVKKASQKEIRKVF